MRHLTLPRLPAPAGRPDRSARRRPRTLLAAAAVLVVVATGCTGGGPGNQDDLVTALLLDDAFTEAEAECIAAAVFDEYGEDEGALGRISGAGSYKDLSGTDGVEGFDDFFTGAVRACTNT
ncbi:MAG: hypothetical protein ACFCVK_02850 [Acidimicrobiales bacterium]